VYRLSCLLGRLCVKVRGQGRRYFLTRKHWQRGCGLRRWGRDSERGHRWRALQCQAEARLASCSVQGLRRVSARLKEPRAFAVLRLDRYGNVFTSEGRTTLVHLKGVSVPRLDPFFSGGAQRGLDAVADPHLAEDLLDVGFHGVLAEMDPF
jgi:hypothetical protein